MNHKKQHSDDCDGDSPSGSPCPLCTNRRCAEKQEELEKEGEPLWLQAARAAAKRMA